MNSGDADKIAKALAEALKKVGLGDAKVIAMGSGNVDDMIKQLPDEAFNEPCENNMHEALTISVMAGFPPGSAKKEKTWGAARKLPHTMRAETIGASMSTPEFWYYLGIGLGWKADDGIGVPEYMIHWHEYINWLGKHINISEKQASRQDYISEFFGKLLKPYLDQKKAEAEARGS